MILDELRTMLSFAFMQQALIAAFLVAIMTGLLGVFVVQRKLSFLGDGLAHTTFGGLAVAWFFGFGTSLWIALVYTLCSSLGIVWIRKRANLAADTVIGIFFAVSVALGIMLMSISEANLQIELSSILFGSILSVGTSELIILAVLSIISLVFFLRCWQALAYSTFDEELAQSDGINVSMLEYLLFAMAAVVIVASVKFVGIILMAANLVIPAATAKLLSKSLSQMTVLSVTIAVIASIGGLLLSYFSDIPSGSTIVLLEAAFFVLALIIKSVLSKPQTDNLELS